jgi:hypothetical protein
MGVLECDRKGCENIMCGRYSHEYGYLCNECFSQLEDAIYYMGIKTFMETDKSETKNTDYQKEDINIFKLRWDDE